MTAMTLTMNKQIFLRTHKQCHTKDTSFVTGLCSWDGTVYCIGGSNGSTGSKFCFKLQPNSTKWERIADLQVGKSPTWSLKVVKLKRVLKICRSIPSSGGCPRWKDLGGGWMRELESAKFVRNLRPIERFLELWTLLEYSSSRVRPGRAQRPIGGRWWYWRNAVHVHHGGVRCRGKRLASWSHNDFLSGQR